MKHNLRNLHGIALLGCALFGLSAAHAEAQTVVRRYGAINLSVSRAIPVVTRSTAFNPLYPPAYYNSLAVASRYYGPNPYGYNPPLGSGSNVAGAPAPAVPGAPPQQTSDTVTAQFVAPGQLLVQWSGNANAARQVSLGIFDANGRMLASKVTTQLPVQTVFTVSSRAAYYGALVQYLDGTSSTTYLPIE